MRFLPIAEGAPLCRTGFSTHGSSCLECPFFSVCLENSIFKYSSDLTLFPPESSPTTLVPAKTSILSMTPGPSLLPGLPASSLTPSSPSLHGPKGAFIHPELTLPRPASQPCYSSLLSSWQRPHSLAFVTLQLSL